MASIDALGEDAIVVRCSDGQLESKTTVDVKLSWPTGRHTRPPTLEFRPPVKNMPEDESIDLGPTLVHFGNGSSLVEGRVQCSAGSVELRQEVIRGNALVVKNEPHDGVLAVRGLPSDVTAFLSDLVFTPPNDWNSRAHGTAKVTVEIWASQRAAVGDANFVLRAIIVRYQHLLFGLSSRSCAHALV